MREPYRESREEGNSREFFLFSKLEKRITPGLFLPYPIP